ncbi:sigma-70 family RNA polymerase sigma factor [Plantactinospora sp. B6F1]|uniref:sigma-70 family RNA polymerase sigma factor n=1 Tax=Plantactinospora sp. B6F1 TaxID=3158971 RepID=UPI0032D940E1
MDDQRLAERFEAHRGHLRAVAYRMLGSRSEADDAVQEAWLRLARSDGRDVENLGAWLTRVVGRVCLDMLRARRARREEPLEAYGSDPLPVDEDVPDPERTALLADSVGVALLVVLDTLAPAERIAFVLHDMFAVPFDEIATILGRSSGAAKMLASRARRRVQTAQVPDPDFARQREIVEAFLAAARGGDLDTLLSVLDPDVTARADAGLVPEGAAQQVHGARDVARQALTFTHRTPLARVARVGGQAAIAVVPNGRLAIAMLFAVRDGRIRTIDILGDPARLRALEVVILE